MHINHDSNEKNVENFKASERSFPLCFASFQFLTESFPKIRNQQSFSFDIEHEEDNELLDRDSLPLCFSSFTKIRENYKKTNKRVVNNISGKYSHELIEDVTCDMEASFTLESHSLVHIEFQITNEISKS